MTYTFSLLSNEQARAIAAWRYEPPYDFYNSDADPADLEELLDRRHPYYAVADGSGDIIGFFCFGETAQAPAGLTAGAYDDPDALDIGLGMRPDLTGRGRGLAFIEAGLQFAGATFRPRSFRLSVATFNHRAIAVYERSGFRPTCTFISRTDKGDTAFVVMVRLRC